MASNRARAPGYWRRTLRNEQRIPPLAFYLGLAGMAPFGVAAVASWISLPPVDPAGFCVAYSAIILAFLVGMRWRELATGAPAVVAALAALLVPVIPGLCLLIAAFLAQALVDIVAVEAGRMPHWQGLLRMMLAAGAVVALILVLARQLI